ncbi:MAG: endonuclease [Bacteroidales bacterium]|nr:endonuclease [Bacteroidales bacterium]
MSKTRHTYIFILTLFFSAGLFSQIPPGYYDDAMGLSGDELKAALHNIIKDHTEYSYTQIKEFLKETDEDPLNTDNVILLYTGRSQNKNTFGGGPDDWNREHVWAKSHGDFGNNPPCGTDIHHIRPTDASVNSSRGNKDFDNGGQQHPEATGCYYTEYTWEPRDEVKGDVARMIFYMAVRYEGTSGELDLEVVDWVNTAPAPEHGKFSALLEWNSFDPPDDFEINRNNVIYSYQNNRNPFIDFPEFVNMIWNPASISDEISTENNIKIYPLPAKDYITIELKNPFANSYTIKLFNIFGNNVYCDNYSFSNNNPLKIDLRELTDGLYFIFIISEKYIAEDKVLIKR